MAVYLDDYPIHSSDEACSRYMAAIDWRLVSQEIETNGVSYFDVSDTLPLFPHLTLDDDYILFCYVTREYHGLWGRVAALQKDTPSPPVNVQPKGPLGPSFELPDAAVPPWRRYTMTAPLPASWKLCWPQSSSPPFPMCAFNMSTGIAVSFSPRTLSDGMGALHGPCRLAAPPDTKRQRGHDICLSEAL